MSLPLGTNREIALIVELTAHFFHVQASTKK